MPELSIDPEAIRKLVKVINEYDETEPYVCDDCGRHVEGITPEGADMRLWPEDDDPPQSAAPDLEFIEFQTDWYPFLDVEKARAKIRERRKYERQMREYAIERAIKEEAAARLRS